MSILDWFRPRKPYKRELTELALGTRTKEVLGSLIEGLERDKDENVRAATAMAIGEVGDSQGVGPLVKALKDRSEIVRVGACISLGRIADPNSVEPLMTAFFNDKSQAVQATAIEQIEQLRTVDILVPILEHNTDEHKRALAAHVLGLTGDQRATAPLQRAAANDASAGVRKAASMALQGQSRPLSKR